VLTFWMRPDRSIDTEPDAAMIAKAVKAA
jgi:hypothetical protein